MSARAEGRGDRARPAQKRRKAKEEVSAGGVVFRRDGEDALFLVIRDSYRNWGFPKGHLKHGEPAERAALREVGEETGLTTLALRSAIDVVDWHFRFKGRTIHKVCHFYLMETNQSRTKPQRSEGITECRWQSFDEAAELISYENARRVLVRAKALVGRGPSVQSRGITGGRESSAESRGLVDASRET